MASFDSTSCCAFRKRCYIAFHLWAIHISSLSNQKVSSNCMDPRQRWDTATCWISRVKYREFTYTRNPFVMRFCSVWLMWYFARRIYWLNDDDDETYSVCTYEGFLSQLQQELASLTGAYVDAEPKIGSRIGRISFSQGAHVEIYMATISIFMWVLLTKHWRRGAALLPILCGCTDFYFVYWTADEIYVWALYLFRGAA